ncbi:MAG: choice-of-anchor D domain-containing protein [Candidatus Cloacimonetes bacterium]|nr:choice-of-anchor D domain-containing protein [Candidatus Cloacimonadota bacterium]
MKKSLFLIMYLILMLGMFTTIWAQYSTTGPSSTADSNVTNVTLVGETQTINYTPTAGVIGLELLTGLVADLNAGSSYTVSVTWGTFGGNYGNAGSIWIDYDQSESFETAELIGSWSGTPTVTESYNFTVPPSALGGVTRMRVMQQEGGVLPLNPDAGFTWGSKMDFGIDITPAVGFPGVATNPNPEHLATLVPLDTGISWTNGVDTDDVQVLFDTVNPPVAVAYDGVAIESLTNLQIGGPLDELTNYYWRVISTNTTSGSVHSPVWSFTTVPPSGLVVIGDGTINSGTSGVPTPYGTFYKNFRQQYLILASELVAAGMPAAPHFFNSLIFDVVNVNTCSAMPNYRIRMKMTEQTSLTTTFEVGEYTHVWYHPNFLPVNGLNNHTFTTPFEWDGVSNILVDILTDLIPGSYTQNASVLNAAYGFNSSLRYQNDTLPADAALTGTTSVNRTNMQFMVQLMEPDFLNDMAAVAISGPDVVNVGSPYTYTVTVRNVGENTQNNYTVYLMDEFDAVIDSVVVTVSLETWESVDVDLDWSPMVEGNTYVYGKVALVGDENPNNDETAPLNITVVGAPVSGTFLVDWAGSGDFVSIADALDYISLTGINGPVIFNVAPGTYNEQVVIPDILGASEVNTITINGMTSRQDAIITYSPTDTNFRYTVYLNGAKHVRLNNLTIESAAGATYGWPILIMNQSEDIEITNNIVNTNMLLTSTSTFWAGIVASGSATGATTAGNPVNGLLLEGNTILGGYYGISVVGATATKLTDIQIIGNEVIDAYYYSVYTNNLANPAITHNFIDGRSTGTTTNFARAIYAYNFSEAFNISYNRVINTLYRGIDMSGCTPADPEAWSMIANNSFAGFNYASVSSNGIYITSSGRIKIYFNSINVIGNTGRAINTTATAVQLDVQNNSFAYTGIGNGYAAYYLTTPVNFAANDYNNYYVADGTTFVYYDGAAQADLAAYQAAGLAYGHAQNSLQGDPLYTSPTNLLPFGPQLYQAGVAIAGIDDDILGNPRPDPPSIGAYEFELAEDPVFSISPESHNFGIVYLGATSIPQTFTISNTGGGIIQIAPENIWLSDDVNFILTNLEEAVDLEMGQSAMIQVAFAPSDDIVYNATLFIEDGLTRVVNEVPLTGEGYDATLYPPFIEDFEAAEFPPTDWTRLTGLLEENSIVTPYTAGWLQSTWFAHIPDNPSGKGARINIWSTTVRHWLVTPPIDLGVDNDYQLVFDLALTAYFNPNPPNLTGIDDRFAVVISTDGVTWSSANALAIWDNQGSPYVYNDISLTGEQIVLDLSAYDGTVWIGFYGESTVSNADNDLHIDNVQVRVPPEDPFLVIAPTSAHLTGTVGAVSLPAMFTLFNTGAGILTINDGDIIFTGIDAADFYLDAVTYPIQVPVGGSAQFGVLFAPTTEGAKEATMVITHNGSNSPTDVPLTGFAYPQGLVIFGTGTAVNTTTGAAPINIYYRSLRGQMVYSAAELQAAGITPGSWLSHFGFYPTAAPLYNLPNFRIRMMNTTATDASAHIDISSEYNVYFNALYAPVVGDWDILALDTPFVWDGVSNILVDTAFDMVEAWNSSGQQRVYNVTNGFRFARSDGANQGEVATTTISTDKPQAIMQFIPGPEPGTIEGTVTLVGGTGVVTDVEVTAGGITVNPLIDGTYVLEIYPGTYNVTASLYGYQTETILDVEVLEEMATTDIDFTLGNIDIMVSPTFFDEEIEYDDAPAIQPLTITSSGAGDLDYQISIQYIWPERSAQVFQSIEKTDEQLANYNPQNAERAPIAARVPDYNTFNREMFDLLYYFPVGDGAGYSVATDGNYIYSAMWNSANFYKYELDGTYIGSFTIAGFAGNLRDMTYDGQYFYGSPNSNTIYILDLANETLIGSFTTTVSNIRGIAYDADNDGFWVTTGWNSPLVLVDRTGVTMQSVTTTAGSYSGIAWDGVTDGGPYIWGYCQAPTSHYLVQIDLTNGSTVQSLDLMPLAIWGIDSISGGFNLTNQLVPGMWTFIGMSQNDIMWVMEYTADFPLWLSVEPMSGTVPAGMNSILDVTFDPLELEFGSYSAQITVSHNAPVPDVVVPVDMLWYSAGPYITYSPDSYYVEIVQGMSETEDLFINNLGAANLSYTITSLADWLSFEPSAGLVLPFDSNTIEVTFDAAELAPGTYNTNIEIVHNAQGDTIIIPVELYVGVPELALDPLAWDYGSIELMNPANKTFVLSNAGGVGTVTVTGFNIAGDFADFAYTAPDFPFDIVDHATQEVVVTFTPQVLGARAANLEIYTGDFTPSIVVPLQGVGVEELIGLPVGLTANVFNFNNVELNWNISYGAVEGWFGWTNRTLDFNAIGLTNGGTFAGAIKFASSDLAAYIDEGFELTNVRFEPNYLGDATTYTIYVWTGDDANLGPTTILAQQAVAAPTALNQWYEIELNNPVPITGTQPIWVGLEITHPLGEYPLGVDDGPNVLGKGMLLKIGTEPWEDGAVYFNYNWNIEAYVELGSGRGERELLSISVPETSHQIDRSPGMVHPATLMSLQNDEPIVNTVRTDRALRGYNVYRNGSQINVDPVMPPYLDMNLPNGIYSYYVVAVYYSQVSMPSNTVEIEIAMPGPMELPFTETWDSGDLTTNNWFAESTHWSVFATFGNPQPSARFYYSPSVYDYDISLISWNLDAVGIDNVTAQFDIYFSSYSTATIEQMSFEVFDGTTWQHVMTMNNQGGSIPWTTVDFDISEHAGNREFKIRFRAEGGYSWNINNWNIDNIIIQAGIMELDAPIVSIEIVSGNVILDWDDVEGANSYYIYASEDPYAEDWGDPIAQVGLPGYSEIADGMKFYKVVASSDAPPVRGITPTISPRDVRR